MNIPPGIVAPVPTPLVPLGPTRWLDRDSGRIAYDVAEPAGRARLTVVLVPGMGDVRSQFRYLAPQLLDAGARVVSMDLRGHGESDTTFDSYDDLAAGSDVLALVRRLVEEDPAVAGVPLVLGGSSMGAAAVTWAAAERPDLVDGLLLLGPFVREVPMSRAVRLAFRLALLRPWGRAVWLGMHDRFYPGRPPADLAEHKARLRASLTRPGGWSAFAATTRTSHAPVETRLSEVRARTLVVMGTADPDFPDPSAEARTVGDLLRGEVVLVDGAGHYPHSERPDVVGPAVARFLDVSPGGPAHA